MIRQSSRAAMVALVLVLTACGGGNNNPNTGLSTASVATPSAAGGNPQGGILLANPPYMLAAVSPSFLQGKLLDPTVGGPAGAQLFQAVGSNLPCAFRSYYLNYTTKGAQGEDTNATGALLVPYGSPQCEGRRDVVMYAHAPNTQKNYNILNLVDTTNPAFQEAGLIAATFAAQGYIVIASNYAGYDISSLPYHAFLNAEQKSREAIDTLLAGRTALAAVSTSTVDSGRLFLTGYSEGGWVSMATQKAMEAAGNQVVANATLAGPYALAAFYDAIFLGNTNAGSTFFTPLLLTSYQKAYGNIYSKLSDVYAPTYINGTAQYPGPIDQLSPGAFGYFQLIANGQLPLTSFFDPTPPTIPGSTALVPAAVQDLAVNGTSASLFGLVANFGVPASPASINTCQGFADNLSPPRQGGPETTVTGNQAYLFSQGFAKDNLIQNTFRGNYLADFCNNPDGNVPNDIGGGPTTTAAFPLRQALARNDMRSFIPKAPILMCGGGNDATVFFINTEYQAHYWGKQGVPKGQVVTLNLDNTQLSANMPQPSVGPLSYTTGSSVAATPDSAIDYTTEINGFTANVKNFLATPGNDLVAYAKAYHQVLLPPWCAGAALKYIKAH